MYTDTHCHIFSNQYPNRDEIIISLDTNNIKRIIVNGYNYATNLEVLKLIDKYDNVYGALGVHPDNLNEGFDESITLIKENINHPKIIAIGEIGLDYYHSDENRNEQISTFIKFLSLAEQYGKPVIIHNREATKDILDTLSKFHVKGVIHCFSGSYEVAKEFIDRGFKLGINGIVTFKNSKLHETLDRISIDNILLETDSPYITPEPFRALKNEPKYLAEIAKKISEVYDITVPRLTEILEKNLLDTFDI